MRASILLWSAASGLILGLFIDATLVGVALLFSALAPAVFSRLQTRWLGLAATLLLAAIPCLFGILGYLEGQLKTT